VQVTQAPSADSRLIRGIGRWALTAFTINLTVGSGIFGLPARIQTLVGNYSVLVIVGCGLLMALIALCFAEIGSRFDRSGGPQLYASTAFGPAAGFTVGWLLWLSRLGTCAAVSALLVDYAGTLWPGTSQPLARSSIISLLVLAYAWVNVRGIKQTSAVSAAFTISKLIPLSAFVAAGLWLLDLAPALTVGSVPSITNLSNAVLLAAFAFIGFDATGVLAGEVRDPPRSVPFAIGVSMIVFIALYSLIQLVCVAALPDLASSGRPLADAAAALVGPSGAVIMALAAMIACAGVFGASLTPGTRLLFAMSDAGQLPRPIARIHPRFATPAIAIVLTSIAALALALSGSFIYLVKVTLIARITVYALTCVILPQLRRRKDVPPAAFSLRGGTVIAYACAVMCVLFLASSSMRELLDVAIAAAIGLVIFAFTRYTQRAPVAASARHGS
jgi:amino acid transporter